MMMLMYLCKASSKSIGIFLCHIIIKLDYSVNSTSVKITSVVVCVDLFSKLSLDTFSTK